MSRLNEREPPLALVDCSFDELVPSPGRVGGAAGAATTTSTTPRVPGSSDGSLSLRDAGIELSSALLERMPPSHASSLVYAPSGTLIVARAIHHDASAGPVLHLTFSALLPPPLPRRPGAASRNHEGDEDGSEPEGEDYDDGAYELQSTSLPDASLQIKLPAPAVDSIGLSVYPEELTDEPRTLHVFVLTHSAHLVQLSIPLTSSLAHSGLSAHTVQRRSQNLGFIMPAPGWASRSGAGAGSMSLVLGSKGRGKTATKVLFVHSGLMLIACEDGTLVKLTKEEGSHGDWRETFLKPTSFLNTLARLIPRGTASVAHSRGGTASSTQLPEPTASFEPTQILAFDGYDTKTSYAIALAVSRDRKLRIWGLFNEVCLNTTDLPRRRPELGNLDANQGARAIARRALGLRSVEGGASGALTQREGSVPPSPAGRAVGVVTSGSSSPVKAPSEYSTATAAFQAGAVFGAAGIGAEPGTSSPASGAPLPRILLHVAPASSAFNLYTIVFVPVPAAPAQARSESFFIVYGIKLSSSQGQSGDGYADADEVVQSVTPLWSCAAADEGEDEVAGVTSVPVLRDMKLSVVESASPAEGASWTLWTGWNTLSGPEVRKTTIHLDSSGRPLPAQSGASGGPALTQEEVAGSIWTSVGTFPCPSAPSSSSSARARYPPLHTDEFKRELSYSAELGTSSIAASFLDRLFEPGRFDIGNLAKAAAWYEAAAKRALLGRHDADDTLDERSGRQAALSLERPWTAPSLRAHLLNLIGAQLQVTRDEETGVLLHEQHEAQVVREWIKYVDRVEKEEDTARFLLGFVGPVVCAAEDDDESTEDDMEEDGRQGQSRRAHGWLATYPDPIMVVANNRLGLPIEELPAETLLRVAARAAVDELDDFDQTAEEDVSNEETSPPQRFTPQALQALAAALARVDDASQGDDHEEYDTSSRIERARLVASFVALGLSVPRCLTLSAASAVIQALGHGGAGQEGQVLGDVVQEAWLAACEYHYQDRIDQVEAEVYEAHGAAADEDEDASVQLSPEAEAHLALQKEGIKEEVSRIVAEAAHRLLTQSEPQAGDDPGTIELAKAQSVEQALWLWLDVVCGPLEDGAALELPWSSNDRSPHSIGEAVLGGVMTADGTLRSLLARRRLVQALLVVLLSLQRSPYFSANADEANDDEAFLSGAIDADDAARTSSGAIPSLPLLLSSTLAALQRIEGLYRLASASAEVEVDPATLLVAAEIDRPLAVTNAAEELGPEVNGSEDLSFDRTVTRMQNLTVQPLRPLDRIPPTGRPASIRNLLSLIVQRRLLDTSFVDGDSYHNVAYFADTAGEGDEHDWSGYNAGSGEREPQGLAERISRTVGGLLSMNGLLGAHLPSIIWREIDALSKEVRADITGADFGLDSIIDSLGPRFQLQQAHLASLVFKAGFPSATLDYLACFSDADNPAIAYLAARALVALGKFDAAEAHIALVARALRSASDERRHALLSYLQQRAARGHERPERLSPTDWEHVEPVNEAEDGIEPEVDPPEAMQEQEEEDDAEFQFAFRPEHYALLHILPISISAALESADPTSDDVVELLYRHFADIFSDAEADVQLVNACAEAIAANTEAKAVTRDLRQAGFDTVGDELVGPPALNAIETLWTTMFRAQLRLGRYADAYATVLAIPLPDIQAECLRMLVGVMCEQNETPLLFSFTFPGLQEKVERELNFKARNSDVMRHPDYYGILHKYHVFRGDLKNAAATMYQQAQALGALYRQGAIVLGANADVAENFLEVAKLQAQSYLAAVNDLALCEDRDARFSHHTVASANVALGDVAKVDPTAAGYEDADLPSLLNGGGGGGGGDQDADELDGGRRAAFTSQAKRRRLTHYVPEWMFQPERRPIAVLRIEDVRREYHLVLARLGLVHFFPEAARPSFVLSAEDAVSLYVSNRKFDTAFTTARELGVDMTPIFERLTVTCVALSASLAQRRKRRAGEDPADGVVERLLASVYDAEEEEEDAAEAEEMEFLSHSAWSANWDGPAADRAWDYVRLQLEMHDGPRSGWKYRQTVLDRCLGLGEGVGVPAWLVTWFEEHKPESLMRSYLKTGRIDDALRQGIRLVSDVSDLKGGGGGPQSTYVPYTLLDEVLLVADDPEERARRRAVSPSLLHTRDLGSELRAAVARRFEVLRQAEGRWVRAAERAGRMEREREERRREEEGEDGDREDEEMQ